MTFESREESQHEGEPVECYRFSSGADLWLFTSADRNIDLPVGVFVRAVIKRGAVNLSRDATGTLDVVVDRTNPLGDLFRAYAPEAPLSLILYKAHRGEENDAVVEWTGAVVNASFEDAEITLHCIADGAGLRRTVPGIAVQSQCPWDLYGVGCGVNKATFTDSAVVSAVSGSTVTSTEFGTHPDGWYENGGWLELANGARRMIVSHVGDVVTLKAPFRALAVDDTVSAVPGCARTQAHCGSKFTNFDVNARLKFAGFDRVPGRNPYEGRVI